MLSAVKKTGNEVKRESLKRLRERYALPPNLIKAAIDLKKPKNHRGGAGVSVELFGIGQNVAIRKYKTKDIIVRKGNRTYKGIKAKVLKKGGFKVVKGGFWTNSMQGKPITIKRNLDDVRPQAHKIPGESKERVFKSSYKTTTLWGPSFLRYLTNRKNFEELVKFAQESLEKNMTLAAEKLIEKFASGGPS
jgi:hypothetical protein